MASQQVLVHALRDSATSSFPAERPYSLCQAEDALRLRDRPAVPAQYLSRLHFLSFESKHCLPSHLENPVSLVFFEATAYSHRYEQYPAHGVLQAHVARISRPVS